LRLLKWVAAPLLLVALGAYGLYRCVFCADPASAPREIVVRLPCWPVQSFEPYVWAPQTVITQGTLFEGLFGYDSALQVVPKIAASWTLSPDRLTWVFQLRTDKRWSDGSAVTAHDFIYGWARFCSPQVPSPTWASVWPSVEKAMDYKAGAVPLDSVGFHALDDSTLVVKLIKPKALPAFLALASALPMHRKSLEAAQARGEGDSWWMPEHFVGNGPYLPKSFVRDGEIELVRNPHYAGPRGNVDRFVLKSMNMSSQNVQIQQYEAGELDVAHVLTLGDFAYATKARHLENQVVISPEIGFTGMQIARTVNKLMNDDNLRRAMALAIDKRDIALNVMGGRVAPTDLFGPVEDTLFRGLRAEAPDREAAKRWLAQSSYRGETIYLFTPPATDIKGLASVAEALQSHLKAIGLKVVIENLEEGMLATYVWGGGYIDDARYTRPGLTLFPGKVLWNDPVMRLRAADHSWDWMNLAYDLKEARKRITLERVGIKNQLRGDRDEDWRELQAIRDTLAGDYARIRRDEPDSIFRNKVLEIDYASQFDQLRKAVSAQTPREERIRKWQAAKDLLLDGRFKFLTYFRNGGNYEGNRIFAHLETLTMEDRETAGLLRRMLQLSLQQNWIIPIFSEKLVYLKRPFLKGESVNKYGMWSMLFNLQYMEVDKDAYFAAAGGKPQP
jgi:peptide/nickel transport system substrate-binding protein